MSSMKYPYRDLGVPFDRNFRNDLNANFDDIEHDIRMIGGEAAQQALEAADEANTQAIYAQTSGDYAQDKGDYAAQQGDYAKTQGDYAKTQGDAANLAATNANDAANNANSAATNANNAATAANDAATNANTAADNANNAATNANTAADNANTQATNAQNAAQSANDAATNANNAADNANTQAAYAQIQGDYAKAQGDYAKQVGDENKTRWLTAVNTYADIAATYPNPQLGDTVQTIDDSKIYRWDGTQWVWTQQYNANAITDVQNKIGILTEKTDFIINVKSLGAKEGPTNAAATTQALRQAITEAQANKKGKIVFPAGDYYINETIIIVGINQNDGWTWGGITIEGQTMRATRLFFTGTGSMFQLGNQWSKMMINFKDIELVGPGKTTNTTAIESKTTGGSYYWENVYIHEFGTGVSFYDVTLTTFDNLNIQNCGTGVKLGWQSDIYNFIGCRIDYCDTGIQFAWDRDGNKNDYLEENCLTFLGCRISNNQLAWKINDKSAGGIKFQGCYFEGNKKEGIIGDPANENSVGVKPFILESCFWDPYVTPTEAISIYCECTVIVRNCMTVSNTEFSTFIKFYNNGYERNSQIIWEENNIKTTTADIIFCDRIYNVGHDSLQLGNRQISAIQGDANRLGNNIWKENQMCAGTNKIWESWSRHASNNNAVLSRLWIKDVNGVLMMTGDTQYPAYLAPTQFPDVASLPNAYSDLRGMLAFVKKADGDIPVMCVLTSTGQHRWVSLIDGSIVK